MLFEIGVKNLKRRGADRPKSRYWTAVKISPLKELHELYKDYRHPNIEINKIIITHVVRTYSTEAGRCGVNNSLDYLAPSRQPPEAKEVENLYKELWGKVGPVDPPIPFTSGGLVHEYFPPVVAVEINERIKEIRNKTAAGPDGLEKKHLQIPGLTQVLALFFNILLYASDYPENWRMNRTTLIPKPNKDLDKAENWRPITISPILAIIFSSILDKRIRRDIVQNIRQKGFTSENGCKINVDVFNATLEKCKKGQGGVYTIVDISKAFDAVPHSAIRPCLVRKGTSTPITDLILNMYNGSKTEIKTKNGTGVEIEVSSGVKQGDLLSPLIFNLCYWKRLRDPHRVST